MTLPDWPSHGNTKIKYIDKPQLVQLEVWKI